MKMERTNPAQEERREFSGESMEPDTNHSGGGSVEILGRDANVQLGSESFLDVSSSRSFLHRADSVPVEGTKEVVVETPIANPVVSPIRPEDEQVMEKWALDNAPPPVKLHREGESSEESSPKELSPPPSPKRMREVEKKGKVFSQGSI